MKQMLVKKNPTICVLPNNVFVFEHTPTIYNIKDQRKQGDIFVQTLLSTFSVGDCWAEEKSIKEFDSSGDISRPRQCDKCVVIDNINHQSHDCTSLLGLNVKI